MVYEKDAGFDAEHDPASIIRLFFESNPTNHTHDIGIVRGDPVDPSGNTYKSDGLVAGLIASGESGQKTDFIALHQNVETWRDTVSSPVIDGSLIREKLLLLKAAKDLLPAFLGSVYPAESLTPDFIHKLFDRDFIVLSSHMDPAKRYEVNRVKMGDIITGWLINYVRGGFTRTPHDSPVLRLKSGLQIIQEMKGDPNDTIDSAAFLLGNKDFWKRTRWICVSGHHYFDSVSKPEDVMGNYGISLDNVGAVRPRKHEEIHGWFYKLSLNNSQYGSFLKFAKYYSDHSFYIEVFGNGETENSLETARREDRYLSVTLAIEDKKLIVPKD